MWEVALGPGLRMGRKYPEGHVVFQAPIANSVLLLASKHHGPVVMAFVLWHNHILLSRTTMEVWGSTRDHSGQPKFSTFTAPAAPPGDSPALQVGLAGLDYPFPRSNCKGGTSLLRTNRCKTSKNQLFQRKKNMKSLGENCPMVPMFNWSRFCHLDHTQ